MRDGWSTPSGFGNAFAVGQCVDHDAVTIEQVDSFAVVGEAGPVAARAWHGDVVIVVLAQSASKPHTV